MQVDFTYLELCALFAHVEYMVSEIWNDIGDPSNPSEYRTWLDIKSKLSSAVDGATLQEMKKVNSNNEKD